jgi:hypothetical protein
MRTLPAAAECGNVPEPDAELNPRARELLAHLARIAYVADRHREALAILSARRASVERELAELEQRT